MSKTKPARRIAIHEAGHALAYWWNGQGIYTATARTVVEMRAGPMLSRKGYPMDVAGVVEAADFINPSVWTQEEAASHSMFTEMVERDLLHCYAGPMAEATYRRAKFGNVLMASGEADLAQVDALLDLLPLETRDAIDDRALFRSGRLVRRYWAAITVIGDLLQEHGTVDGEDLTATISSFTGETPGFREN
ncbi:MAG: hypothetical protein ACRER8_22195 [Pseudomonas sp.]|uniref:hypothetical protein n=1 Tax=Pseudomonas sp. TaxID=306 RepID=UPI003D6EF36A